MSKALEDLRDLCSAYITDMAEAYRIDTEPSKLFNSLLSGKRESWRCTDIFADNAEKLFTRMDSPEDLAAAADYVLTLAIRYKEDDSLGLMFSALLSFITPKLTEEVLPNGDELRRRILEAFPKSRRTPVINDFLKRLG